MNDTERPAIMDNITTIQLKRHDFFYQHAHDLHAFELIQDHDLQTGRLVDRLRAGVFGEVIGIHIADDLITRDGLIDVAKLHPIARLGYQDYTEVTGDTCFTMNRPEP